MMHAPSIRWITALLLLAMVGGGTMAAAAQVPDATPQGSSEDVPLPAFNIRSLGGFENPWFDVTIAPGEAVNLRANIRNTGEVQVELSTFPANAVNPANGGFSAGTEADDPVGATLWLAYPEQTMTLAPGEGVDLDFTVSVPADTPAGEYFAALVVQTAEPWPVPGTDVFNQIVRSTVSVEITVPGDMTSGFELGEPAVTPASDHWIVDIPITNTGTARLRPQGTLAMTIPDGESVSSTDVRMESVYGGSTTSIRARLPEHLPLGDYLLSLDLTDEDTGASAAIDNVPITLAEPEVVVEEKVPFVVEEASVTPNGEPVQYAGVAAVITNNGPAIPTANVTLNVQRDGEEVESYPLAENQALPQGTTDFSQRYIPVDGWQAGTYSFELVISAVSGNTETVIATVEIPDEITVP